MKDGYVYKRVFNLKKCVVSCLFPSCHVQGRKASSDTCKEIRSRGPWGALSAAGTGCSHLGICRERVETQAPLVGVLPGHQSLSVQSPFQQQL